MSNELLSQDEIDALLHGVDSGSVGLAPPTAPGEVRVYDFASQGRVVRGKLAGLDAINERFVRAFRTGLSGLVHRPVELTARGVEVLRFDAYMHALSLPANLNIVSARPLRGSALVVFEPQLVLAAVDNFFGGGGRYPAKLENRELTPTELRVTQLMLRQALTDLTSAWGPVAPLGFQAERVESNPVECTVLEARDLVVVSRFSVGLDGGGGELHVALPYAMLEPLRDELERATPRKPRADTDAQWARNLRAGVEAADLEIGVAIARRTISLRDLSRLKVGDIIPIELARIVQIEVEQTPMFEGEFGTHNGHNAIKVTEVKFPAVASSNDSDDLLTATP